MKYLWDTDTCVYFLNGSQSIQERLSAVGAESICVTTLTIAELRYGCYKSSHVNQNLEKVRRLQELLYTLSDLDDEVATLFGKNKAVLRKQGVTIGDIDLLIGSVAVVRGFILVTNNVRHYQHIPDLNSENWSTPKTA